MVEDGGRVGVERLPSFFMPSSSGGATRHAIDEEEEEAQIDEPVRAPHEHMHHAHVHVVSGMGRAVGWRQGHLRGPGPVVRTGRLRARRGPW